MRLSEYLEVGRKMKTARTNAGISQRDMAMKLALSNSSYSNYENGYSEPPAEIIIKFCDVLNITMENLLELKVAAPRTATIRTFADFLSILQFAPAAGQRCVDQRSPGAMNGQLFICSFWC